MSWDWGALKKQQEGKRSKINLAPKKKSFDVSNIIEWLPVVGYCILAIVFVVTFWYIGRWANYKFSYEKKFQQMVIEMVKPESLKEKYRKE